MISFLVLGAGGAVPTPTHGPAAYWVGLDGRTILLDPGPGALVRLLSSPHGCGSVDEIEVVLLTHLHIDHCADLAPLLFALHSPVPESQRPLQLFGPAGLRDYLERLRGLYGDWLTPHRRELQTVEIGPGRQLTINRDDPMLWSLDGSGGGPSVTVFEALHPQSRTQTPCLCYRFRDSHGNSAAFSGDTEPCAGLTAASREADLLVVECSTPDEWAMPGHMSPSRVGRLCSEAAPGRVVLTHLYPAAAALDLAALVGRYYDGPVIAAKDGDYFQVPAEGAVARS